MGARFLLDRTWTGQGGSAVLRNAGCLRSQSFGSTKASLFEAVVSEFWSDGIQSGEFPQAGDPWTGLRKIGTDFASFLRQPQLTAFYRVLIAESPRFPELGRLLTERGKLPYLNRVSGYMKKEANAGRLQILDESRIARQFLAMISDQLFWPAMLTPDFSASDREAKQAVEEALLTIMSRCGSQSRRHDRSSPTCGPV